MCCNAIPARDLLWCTSAKYLANIAIIRHLHSPNDLGVTFRSRRHFLRRFYGNFKGLHEY